VEEGAPCSYERSVEPRSPEPILSIGASIACGKKGCKRRKDENWEQSFDNSSAYCSHSGPITRTACGLYYRKFIALSCSLLKIKSESVYISVARGPHHRKVTSFNFPISYFSCDSDTLF